MRTAEADYRSLQKVLDLMESKAEPVLAGIAWANLTLVRNGFQGTDAEWAEFLNHLAFPDHYPNLQEKFLIPLKEHQAYQSLTKVLAQIFDLGE